MFEHSLIDLETRRQPARRRWISLPVAVALHLVAFAAFGFGTYWSVGTVPEPPVNIEPVMILQLPPVPPPPSGGHPAPPPTPTHEPAPAPQPTPTAPTVQQPTVVPDHLEPAAPSTSTMPEIAGVPTTSIPGNGSDTPGHGDDPCCGPGPGNGDDPSGPVRLTAAMTPPVAIVKVQPRYTETARRANIQGVVVVEAVVDEQGRVTDARVLRGLPMGLDRAAIEAIQQWKFRPAMMQDRPVKVYFTLTATFTLQR